MAKGDYYFPLYYKKLLTSTTGWKDDEFGAYLRLLIHQFDKGKLPSDINELSLLCTSIKKNKNRVLKKFKETEDGHLINDVMDDIYQDVQWKKSKNSENGKKGGRPKNNRNETGTKPNGFNSETETKGIPIINNQQSRENTGTPAFDLSKSNLNRQPKIPTKHEVWEVFSNNGGTKEMAKAFYNKYEGLGWFLSGSPIVNFASLVPSYITNWNKNEKKEPESTNQSGPPLKKL